MDGRLAVGCRASVLRPAPRHGRLQAVSRPRRGLCPGSPGLTAPSALQAALDFVVEEDLKAHLTCWYIQKYVKENPLPQYLERLQP